MQPTALRLKNLNRKICATIALTLSFLLLYSTISSGAIIGEVTLSDHGVIQYAQNIILNNGWENQPPNYSDPTDNGTWTGTFGSPIVQSTIVYSGNYSLECTPGASVYKYLSAGYNDLFVSFYVYFTNTPAAVTVLSYIGDSNWINTMSVSVGVSGGNTYWSVGLAHYVAPIQTGQWYSVEIEREVGAGNGVIKLWINGVNVSSSSTQTVTNNGQVIDVGNPNNSSGITLYVDNVVVMGTSSAGPSASVNTPINTADWGHVAIPTSNASFIANNFNMMFLNPEKFYKTTNDNGTALATAIEADNSSTIVLAYMELPCVYPGDNIWNTINANPNWFILDASGNRIMSNSNGWLLMNISNIAYEQFWVNNINSILNNTVYEGVFADDVHNLITATGFSAGDFNATVPASVISSWHSDMISFLTYIETHLLPGKLLIINSDDWTNNDYLNLVNGEMDEGFAHATWHGAGNYSPNISSILNEIAQASSYGKIVWCASGTKETDQTNVTNTLIYCYAAFLCAINGSQTYLSFNNWQSPDGSQGYYPIMNTIAIGNAEGSYYYNQNVFMRDFTGGKVLFNPSGNSYNVNLGGNYHLLNGTIVSNIVLDPWNGEILLS